MEGCGYKILEALVTYRTDIINSIHHLIKVWLTGFFCILSHKVFFSLLCWYGELHHAHDLSIFVPKAFCFFICFIFKEQVKSVTRVCGEIILFQKITRMLMIASYNQKFGHWVLETRGGAVLILRSHPTSTVEMLGRYYARPYVINV